MSNEIVRNLIVFALAACGSACAGSVTIDVTATFGPENLLVPTADLTGSFVLNESTGVITSVDLTVGPILPSEPAEPFYTTYTVLDDQDPEGASVYQIQASPVGASSTVLSLRFVTATGPGNEGTLVGYTGGALCTVDTLSFPDPAQCEDLNSTVDKEGIEGDALLSGTASEASAGTGTSAAPEPKTLTLLCLGLAGFVSRSIRSRRRSASAPPH
jgi:PEP-CTERM motif